MAEPAPTLTRHDLEAKIIKRCWESEAFRNEFTTDPVGAFVKYLEVPPASLPKIVIHKETAGSWYIVLPQRPPGADELSEEELERVAAGSFYTLGASFSVIASVAASVATMSAAAGMSATLKSGW
jgi:hypothetical protein